MKETFRDRFLAVLQQKLDQLTRIGIADAMGYAVGHLEAGKLVEAVEQETHRRLEKKSPAWLYQKIQNAICRRMDGTPAVLELVDAIVRDAKIQAAQPSSKSGANSKEVGAREVIMMGHEFIRMVNALKPALNEADPNSAVSMLQLFFDVDEHGQGVVDGYTCNGYMLLNYTAPCVWSGTPFDVYIRRPQILPQKFDVVTISSCGEYTTVSFGEVSFRYKYPCNVKVKNLRQLLDKLGQTEVGRIRANPELLKKAVDGIIAADRGEAHKSIHISIGGPTEAIHIQGKNSKAYVLPLRPSKGSITPP